MYISEKDAKKKYCPMAFLYAEIENGDKCQGSNCMAWVWMDEHKYDEHKYGRCGMVKTTINNN